MLCILLTLLIARVSPFVFGDYEIFPCVSLPLGRPFLTAIPPGSAWENSTLTGVILESRDDSLLISTIASALANFPPHARIQVFHSAANAKAIYSHFLPQIYAGKMETVLLSCERFEVNTMLSSPHFWRAVVGEDIVIFQLDGTLCSGGRERLMDFVGRYDFVGAPWATEKFVSHIRSPVGNGGFSLRTRSTHLAIAERFNYYAWYARGLRDSHITGWSLNEDLYFVHYMPAVGGRVAPAHIAHAFSVETVFHPSPVGAHAFWKHTTLTETNIFHLLNHCPELSAAWAKEAFRASDERVVLFKIRQVQAAARSGRRVDGETDAAETFGEVRWRTFPGLTRSSDAAKHVAAAVGPGADGVTIAARMISMVGGGAASPWGSMTIGWRVSSPVWTVFSGGLGDGGSESPRLLGLSAPIIHGNGNGTEMIKAPLLATRGAGPDVPSSLAARTALLPSIALSLNAELNAGDWLASQAAWAKAGPGLRWSRLPAFVTERRQRIDVATDADLPPWTPARLTAAGALRPWWLRAAARVVPPDFGASEDTALRQAAGVVSANAGAATAALVVGPAARPTGHFASRLQSLLKQEGGTPLRARRDWDIILLGGISPLPQETMDAILAVGGGGPVVFVYAPPLSHGLLAFSYPAPPPPPPPSRDDVEAAATQGLDVLMEKLWRPRWQPLLFCPPAISATGPSPAYLVRPSRGLLTAINEIRAHSTANLVTTAHPDAEPPKTPRRSPHKDPWAYADALEPPGVIPWLCGWRNIVIWAAMTPIIARDGGADHVARGDGGEGEGELRDGEGGWGVERGITEELSEALAAVTPAALAAGRTPVLRCTRSLRAVECVAEMEWLPPAHPEKFQFF